MRKEKFEALCANEMSNSRGGRWKHVSTKSVTDGCTADYYQEVRFFPQDRKY